MASHSKLPQDGNFLYGWGSLLGGCLFELRRLTINFLFAREFNHIKGDYIRDGVLVQAMDTRKMFNNAKDPIVKQMDHLLNTNYWILDQFARLNDLDFDEMFTERKSFQGFSGPRNWKRPPQNEAEYKLYIPDLLLTFLVYSTEKLLESSKGLLNVPGIDQFHFNPQKLPASKNSRNAVLVKGATETFARTVVNVGLLRMRERN